MSLSEINQWQKVRIVRVKGRSAFRHRITEMGFVKGQTVEVLHAAPLRDPVVYKILGSEISLRREEAKQIEVELVQNQNAKEEKTLQPTSISEQDIHHEITSVTVKSGKRISVCMVGNPNSGKTSLYNVLSGKFEHVGNYSGVTVDKKSTIFIHNGCEIELTDLPGTYSLSPYSPEEKFVRDALVEKRPDIVINVIDSSNIERNLYLTTLLIDMDMTLLLSLNMSDEMEKAGSALNEDLFGKLLGAPAVRTVAKTGQGREELLNKIIEIYNNEESTNRHIHIPYNEDVENDIRYLQHEIVKDPQYTDIYSSRFLAIKLIEDDTALFEKINILSDLVTPKASAEAIRVRLREIYEEEPDQVLSNSRYAFINGVLKETYKENRHLKNQLHSRDNRIDSVLTHKIWGFPIFLFFLWVMFQTTFFIGQYPMDWIETGVAWLNETLHSDLPNGWFKDLMLDGVLAGIGGVIVFLPNILILFFFISIMEATGYMARVAFIMDKFMHTIGLHGRSFVPLIIGFGCNVPAIMATRTIENRKDRIVTMMIIPFMSCSARLPVYILLVGAFFAPAVAGSVIFGIYLFGVLISVLSALLFHKVLLRHEESPFVMEMPPYRVPTARFVWYSMRMRAQQFLKKIGGVILVLSVVIWVLGYFPRVTDTTGVAADVGGCVESPVSCHYERSEAIRSADYPVASIAVTSDNDIADATSVSDADAASISDDAAGHQLEQSYLGRIGHFIEPALRPLGFDWKMGICLLSGIAAKETVASTMQILFDVSQIFTPLTALAFIAFILLYMPCVAVFAAVRRESESWKWPFFLILYTTAVAYIISMLIYQIGSLI
ncbi:MAG: ferrous iron transport protein B [Bacteroidales bacterium]|jgi:ferrous iron transport protein B|nr:ferrous iron transport protein B [Bacteroidales bacterium]